MIRRVVAWIVVLSVFTGAVCPAWAQSAVVDGLSWLKLQQQPDGGITNGFAEGSDLGTTCDTIMAIAAGGQRVNEWLSDNGNSPVDYLEDQLSAGTVELLGLKAKVALTLLFAGEDPTAFAGQDLVSELEASYESASGSYGSTVYDQALILVTLARAGRPLPEGAIQNLLDNQSDDGSWALFGPTEDSVGDTNTTAMVIQALIVADRLDEIDSALDYLHRVQNDDGGFPYQNPSDYGTDSDANSTAVVLQALLAAGESPDDWAPQGTDPMQALELMQDTDTGAFFWQAAVATPNVLATAQAIPALAGYTLVDLPQIDAATSGEPVVSATPSLLPTTGGAGAATHVLLLVGGAVLCASGVVFLVAARARERGSVRVRKS
ncbi:MAG: terpene cyclase/mutase family protein [Chloroflexi bacterium]|nr:terpene cyclase/mutase family protein [Chloroflexota bacterium]